jgi:tripartite-type tricarboxylate transporter receptor subunit TctC
MGLRVFFALFFLLSFFPLNGNSQTFPSRPIRIIVPFPPGGGTDVGTRVIAQKLQEALGQPVVVENKGGAAGILGTEFTAKAAPDGYTLMMGNIGTHAINVSLYKALSYDPVKDFAPISQVAGLPMLLLVHPSLKANSVAELIALAKAKPGGLNYSSSGAGGMPHVSAALFASMTGIELVHIPYKGGGPAVADLIAGHVSLSFATALESLPQAKSGRLRALAVSSARRSVAAPELPTIAEAGVPGYESGSWLALFAPAGTPKEITARLSAEAVRIVNLPDVRERLLQQGAEPIGSTPEQLAATQQADIAKYARVLKDAGVRPE